MKAQLNGLRLYQGMIGKSRSSKDSITLKKIYILRKIIVE